MLNLFKKNIAIILTVILLSGISFSFASEETTTFQQGNEYYQQKHYDKAVETYEKLVQSGYEGTSLYYNLGNAYYRTGKVGYAILYYEKALKLSPGDDDIIHNLNIANLKIIDKVESLPEFFLFQWWEGLLAFFSSFRMDNCYIYILSASYFCNWILFLYKKSFSSKNYIDNGSCCTFLVFDNYSFTNSKVEQRAEH